MHDRANVQIPVIPDWQWRLVAIYKRSFLFFLCCVFIPFWGPWIAHLTGAFEFSTQQAFACVNLLWPVALFIRCIVFFPSDPAVLRGIFKNRIWLALVFHNLSLILATLAFESGVIFLQSQEAGRLTVVALGWMLLVYPTNGTVNAFMTELRIKNLEERSRDTFEQESN